MNPVTSDAQAQVKLHAVQDFFDRLPILTIEKDGVNPSYCFCTVPRPPIGSIIIYRSMDLPGKLILMKSTEYFFHPQWEKMYIGYDFSKDQFCYLGKDPNRAELIGPQWNNFGEIASWAGGRLMDDDQVRHILDRFQEIRSFLIEGIQPLSYYSAPIGTFFIQPHPEIDGRFFLLFKDQQGERKIPISITGEGQIIALLDQDSEKSDPGTPYTFNDFSELRRPFHLIKSLLLWEQEQARHRS